MVPHGNNVSALTQSQILTYGASRQGLSSQAFITLTLKLKLHGDKDVPHAAAQFGNRNYLLKYVLRDFYLQYVCSVWFNNGREKY